MLSKLDYTRQILKQLPADLRPSEDYALSVWWQDIRPEGGLRLSPEGCVIFKQAGVAAYEFEIPPSTPAKVGTLLILNKKLTCPYYIITGKNPKIVFYGSKEATMFALYGDIQKFLQGISQN